MRTFLTSAFFYALLPACSGQPPTVENLRILSGDQLALLRTVIQQNFPDNEIAKSDTELRLRLSQFQTATILFDKSAATGSKYWYSDRNSSLPTARDFVDATDHQNLIDYAASGLHKRGFSVSGGVVMELRNESRTVTETILKPVTETVSRTIQTPNGPRVVHEKVTKYVEEKVQKTITVSVPVEKIVAPPTAELKALLDELNRTANPSVKKTLERIVGAKFAEQYPVGKTIPGAESAVVLADKYRLAVLNDAKAFLSKQSATNAVKSIGEPQAFGQKAKSTNELLQKVNGAMPYEQFDVGAERFACVWSGSTLVAVRVPKQQTVVNTPIVLGADWKPRVESPPIIAPSPIPAPAPATRAMIYPNHRTG